MMNEDEKKASMIELRVRWDRVHKELKAVGKWALLKLLIKMYETSVLQLYTYCHLS